MQKIKNALSGQSASSDEINHSGSDPRMGSNDSTATSRNSMGSTSPRQTGRSSIDRDERERDYGRGSSGGVSNPSGQLPVREGVAGRAEEGGAGSRVSGHTPGFKDPHTIGHDHSSGASNNFDLKTAIHDHTHLGHVTHDHHHKHQTEEVRREKEHERHIHHVQHHVQPVLDEKHHERQVRENIIPTTHIHEKHGSTKEDIAAFQGLQKHRDEEVDHGTDRKVVDLGETVNERVQHHVHNVVQPVLKTDHHHHETIQTVIPTKHVSHEAPTVHESLTHQPVSKADFLKQGGQLGSGISHNEAGILTEGGCDREVDGVGEKMAQKLGLKSGTMAHQTKGDTRI